MGSRRGRYRRPTGNRASGSLTAPPTSPMEVPISAWLAVFGGAVGMAAGVLEVWHERLSEEPEDVQQVVPDESAGESGLRSPEE